jgi:hypothetical protein
VAAALLAALKDDHVSVRVAAAWTLSSVSTTDQRIVRKILARLLKHFGLSGDYFAEIERLTEGRQLPGYRWRSLQGRREARERFRRIARATGTGLAIGVGLYLGGEWYAGLPKTSQMKAFLKAVPAISTLLGLLWGLFSRPPAARNALHGMRRAG